MDEMSEICGHGGGKRLQEKVVEKEKLEQEKLSDRLARIGIGPSEEEDEEDGNSGRRQKTKKEKTGRQEMIRMRSLDESAKERIKLEEYELADDAIDELAESPTGGGGEMGNESLDDEDDFVKIGCDTADTQRKAVGKEELPVGVRNSLLIDPPVMIRPGLRVKEKFATFPRMRRRTRLCHNRISLKVAAGGRSRAVPTRKTKDGTSIYYWCDLGRKKKGEEDGKGAKDLIIWWKVE